jgi:hypothetical protein
MFPDYNWLPWKFEKSPQGFWENSENRKKFMNWAAKELNIKEMKDWYKVTHKVHLQRYQ